MSLMFSLSRLHWRIRRGLRLLQGVFTGLVVLALAMCGAPQEGGESHTGNFLLSCSSDQTCKGGAAGLPSLECSCSFCTTPCTEVKTCEEQLSALDDPTLRANLRCRPRPPACTPDIQDDVTTGVCDVACESDLDCSGYGRAFLCVAGYCRQHDPLLSPAGPPLECPTGTALVRGSTNESVADLCVDLFEVTVSAYRGCVSAGVCSAPALGNYFVDGADRYPVDFVSPDDANDYCQYAEQRLPTRAEWGWAAQNGSVMTLFPWGDRSPDVTDAVPRVCALTTSQVCAVGSFEAGNSATGLADLAGNVAELVLDGAAYCVAGGSFKSTNADMPATVDSLGSASCDPYTVPAETIGFRCVALPR